MSSNNRNSTPNFLIIMSDEHGGQYSSVYGNSTIETPAMERLAEEGVTFESAYCNSPLCVPSRINFMTGQYNCNCKGWDNATPMREDAVTWPYLLRSKGYDVVLSGKMHLVGVDHLHGFSRQLAKDIHSFIPHPIYPWKDGIKEAKEPWQGMLEAGSGLPGHPVEGNFMPKEMQNRGGKIPTGAGMTAEIETDDLVEASAVAYLKDPARKQQPFALCVGFIAPHFPFVVPEPYFSQYWPEKADLPNIPDGHLENLPPAAQRLRTMCGFWGYTDEQIRRARAAYYGLITYMDAKIMNLLDTLDKTGLAENTVVIHTSDHGDMLGEHGLWRKMSFYEQAARVPLQIRWPNGVPGGVRIKEAASVIDATATVLDLSGFSTDEQKSRWLVDGDTLFPLVTGKTNGWKNEAFCEHNAHGTDRPRAMIRTGDWKLCYSYGEPGEFELYNLKQDPGEFTNLADDPQHANIKNELFQKILERWDGEKINREVIASQEERMLIRSLVPEARLF